MVKSAGNMLYTCIATRNYAIRRVLGLSKFDEG